MSSELSKKRNTIHPKVKMKMKKKKNRFSSQLSKKFQTIYSLILLHPDCLDGSKVVKGIKIKSNHLYTESHRKKMFEKI